MATVSAKVFKHHLKADGTYNVKIKIYHKGVPKWIDTEHFVTDKQLSKKMAIRDPFVNNLINKRLDEYRLEIGKLGNRLPFFTCEELKNYLETYDQDIDFIKFCSGHIDQLLLDKREGTAANHRTVKYSLIDFFRREKVSIMEINSNMLRSYERFLKGERDVTRPNQGKMVTKQSPGLKDKGVHNLMRDLRTLFNEAKKKYNNEDLGVIKIPHSPFKNYKIPKKPAASKRNHTIEQIRAILDCQVKEGSRAELAKDLYMLSFYLCGMNAVDLYKLKYYHGNRVEYNRSKTEGVRNDNAFISIRIPEPAKPLLDKYLGKLKIRYAHFRYLDKALSVGCRQLSKITGIPEIGYYWARGSFATIARNKCKISKDDIALALNHVDEGNKTTDIYIEKDWSVIDNVQTAVIRFFLKENKKGVKRSKMAA